MHNKEMNKKTYISEPMSQIYRFTFVIISDTARAHNEQNERKKTSI